ncbi:tetratricopeptide repeat protein [Anaerostipes sp.]|uniref:tetratricopeptide repeat protein n=1 Tax=Anaerostipes sp. TaxID=1872530 RepID=UPI0025C3D27C|nr:tetratricopeptide repeat protein [Anaerostipes sp.]MBS7008076.1 sel1 repeat family protein [Anaerostipes sp.]
MQNIFKIDGEEQFLKGLELLTLNEQWNLRKALSYFCIAAEKGHNEAIFQVGYLSLFGMPQIAQNVSKAVECFKISAESGLVIAKYYLAECYLSGMGIEKNEKLAIELFQETLKLGYVWSADRLSDIYKYGIGIQNNKDKALEYNNYARQAKLPYAEIKYLGLITGR